jgi:hypothetical protein
MRKRMGATLLCGVVVAAASLAAADTLVLRDGHRVDGELIRVDGDTVEFREQGFFGGGRARRYDRADVSRIDLEDSGRRGRSDDEDRGGGGGGGGFGGGGGGRPHGLRERGVSVSASTRWTDTGIDVRSGQTLYFEASGQVHWGKDRRDGPEGEHHSPFNRDRPIPSRPAAALIGRVGDDTGYMFIGDEQGPIRVRSSGRLYLGINDDALQDNSGAFRVTVYY